MACGTDAHQVARFHCQLWIFVKVFDVVHGCRLPQPAIPLAHLASVSIAPQDRGPHLLPASAVIKLLLVHTKLAPGFPGASSERSAMKNGGSCLDDAGSVFHARCSCFGCFFSAYPAFHSRTLQSFPSRIWDSSRTPEGYDTIIN